MRSSVQAFKKLCVGTARDRRNELRIVVLAAVWMGAWFAADLAIDAGWIASGAPATAAAVLCALLGLGPFLAYWRFLREADELRRKIELEALALAFGVGVVGGVSYWFLEVVALVQRAELSHVVVVMLLVHAVGVLAGHRRYR